MNLDNPLLHRWEHAGEERLEKRNAILPEIAAPIHATTRRVVFVARGSR